MRTEYMNVAKLAPEVRSRGRRALKAALCRVPSGPLESLRASFPKTDQASLRHRLERGALELARHRGIPSELDDFPVVDNPEVRFTRVDSFIAERAYWFGERFGYEPGGIHCWREFCRTSKNILELGANIGYYTVHGARAAPTARYVAVEPHPGCAETCRRNLQINNINSVTVVEAAAVNEVTFQSLDLLLPGGHDHYAEAPCTGFVGRNELHRDDFNDPSYKTVAVPAVELRSLIGGVDLLKLDVEGQEYDLLFSVLAEVTSLRPTIFLELLDETPKLRSLIVDFCNNLGFRCFTPTLSGLVPIPTWEIESSSVQARSNTRDVVLSCAPA